LWRIRRDNCGSFVACLIGFEATRLVAMRYTSQTIRTVLMSRWLYIATAANRDFVAEWAERLSHGSPPAPGRDIRFEAICELQIALSRAAHGMDEDGARVSFLATHMNGWNATHCLFHGPIARQFNEASPAMQRLWRRFNRKGVMVITQRNAADMRAFSQLCLRRHLRNAPDAYGAQLLLRSVATMCEFVEAAVHHGLVATECFGGAIDNGMYI